MLQFTNQKIGILGGGQLGKMLAQAANQYDLDLWVLDKSAEVPSAPWVPHFVAGDFTNYDDVLAFGRGMDIVTIEIERVNTAALQVLASEGVRIYPQASIIQMIKDKGSQKAYYLAHDFPTSEFMLCEDKKHVWREILYENITYPFVQKARQDGYDGRGVAIIRSEEDLPNLMDTPCVIEDLVVIKKELAVMIARNVNGEISSFPVVEMVFNQDTNMLDYLRCPSHVSQEIKNQALKLSTDLISKMDMIGLLAIEFFLNDSDELLINEIAPRAHNSGHHTIEATQSSQFQHQLHALLNLPFGATHCPFPAAMINVVGEDGYTGSPIITGLNEILKLEGVHFHWYGKKETRPHRKMGHVTIVAPTEEKLIPIIKFVKEHLKVTA